MIEIINNLKLISTKKSNQSTQYGTCTVKVVYIQTQLTYVLRGVFLMRSISLVKQLFRRII